MIQYYEQVSRNVCQTCRFFGISRSQFYVWLRRYREAGISGLQDRPRGPRISPYRVPPEIEALINSEVDNSDYLVLLCQR